MKTPTLDTYANLRSKSQSFVVHVYICKQTLVLYNNAQVRILDKAATHEAVLVRT